MRQRPHCNCITVQEFPSEQEIIIKVQLYLDLLVPNGAPDVDVDAMEDSATTSSSEFSSFTVLTTVALAKKYTRC